MLPEAGLHPQAWNTRSQRRPPSQALCLSFDPALDLSSRLQLLWMSVLTLVLPGCAHWLGALGACSVRRLEPCSPTVQPCPPAAHPGGEGCPGGLAGATAEVSSRAAVTSCLFVDIPSFLQMTHPERSGVGGEQSCLG